MSRRSRFSPEARERAVAMVAELRPEHSSQWAAEVAVAEKLGVSPQTLHSWVNKADAEGGPA